MDLVTHLRAFLAVAEEEHVTRAAEKLGTAQPVVSRQLKTLERQLGIELFNRAGRQIVLTDAARQLMPVARDLIERADRILEMGRQLGARERSTVRLAVPYAAEVRLLAEAIRIAAEHQMSLTLIEAAEGERRERLADRRADLALVRVTPERADFVVPLGFGMSSLNGSASAAAGHRHPRPLYLDSLRGRSGGRRGPVILVQPEDTLPRFLDDLSRAAGHAGLSIDQIELVRADALTPARVLAGQDLLLCSRSEAHRFGLLWRPAADRLERPYALESCEDDPVRPPVELERVLRRALGGRTGVEGEPGDQQSRAVPAGLFG